MSKHLTDKERKQVIADFVVLGTYAAVSRKHKIPPPHTQCETSLRQTPILPKNAAVKKNKIQRTF